MTDADAPTATADSPGPLRRLLELEVVKPDAFLGSGVDLGYGRIYGGEVVAQALRAASLTVDAPHRPHSLHAYFVRQGDVTHPVLYEVERVRDGGSFSTRQVVAYQAGGAILNLIASFQVDEDGEDNQGNVMPEVIGPEGLAPTSDTRPFEDRIVVHRREPEPQGLVWMRTRETLPDDPIIHACALAYLSDEHPLGVALLPHSLGSQWDQLMAASLDHALWLHRPARADEWLLFDLRGHGVANGRGLSYGRIYSADGRHVATVAQEGLVRLRRP